MIPPFSLEKPRGVVAVSAKVRNVVGRKSCTGEDVLEERGRLSGHGP
jgi:hypothetical protein